MQLFQQCFQIHSCIKKSMYFYSFASLVYRVEHKVVFDRHCPIDDLIFGFAVVFPVYTIFKGLTGRSSFSIGLTLLTLPKNRGKVDG